MKKVLFAGLLAIAGVTVNAQNLIKNEKFATEVTNKVTNANKATAGEWFIMNNETDGATTIAWEQTGDAKYPNAMKIDNSSASKNISWYKAFLGQRVTDGLEKGIYVLTFYAKAKEAGTPVSVYIKEDVSPEYFFVAIYSISVAISGIVATDRIVVSATPLEAVS